MNKLLLFFLIAISVSSCTKLASKGINSNFPNTFGSWWVYAITDSSSDGSLLNHYDVTVNISGNRTTVLGNTATIWEYHYPTFTDTNFVIANTDSVNIYFNSIALNDVQLIPNPSLKLYQPFSKWLLNKSNSIDLFVTLHNDTTFNSPYLGQVYTYHTWYYHPEIYTPTYYDFWYKDGLGLVKKLVSHWDPISNVTSYNIWNLKSYQIN